MKRKAESKGEEASGKRAKEEEEVTVTRKPISRVCYPSVAPDPSDMPCNAGVIIGGYMWKGSFVTLDKDMFVHTVTGRQDLTPSKYDNASYIATSIVTDSVPITESNSADMSDRLLDHCFPMHDRSSWDTNHLRQARQAWDRIDWKTPFDLGVWLERHATEGQEEEGAWARYMLDHAFVRVYIMCLHTALLLRHYSWSAIDKMPALDRVELLKLLKRDPYLLCFKHLYSKQFPTLPELRLEKLDWKTHRKMGADKIANVWLYRALQATERCHGDTYTDIEKHGRRIHIKLGRGDEIDENNRTFRGILAGFNTRQRKNDDDQFLPKLIDDAGPAIERLEQQQSVFVQNNRVMIRCTWDQTAFIARTLRDFAQKRKTRPSLAEKLAKDQAVYTDDFWTQLALQSETGSSSAASPPPTEEKKVLPPPPPAGAGAKTGAAVVASLCQEQKNAHGMVLENAISIIVGPGGSGKTEIVRAIDGCGEHVFTGDLQEVIAAPERFYTKGNAHVVAIREAKEDADKAKGLLAKLKTMVILVKAHLLVVTPTGKAANVATVRSGRRAHTAKFVIVFDKHNPGRFDEVRTLVIDEAGMFDEDQFAELLLCITQWGGKMERLVIMGDHRQLRSVGKGQILIDLLKSWIPRSELTLNHRVKESSRKLAYIGKAIALERYDEVVPDGKVCSATCERDLRLETLAKQFQGNPRDCQVMTYTRACRSRINRAFMITYGFAAPSDYKMSKKDEWITPDPLPISKGEKIVFTKNLRKPDLYDVQNGQIEIVADIWDVDADAYDRARAAGDARAVDALPRQGVEHTDAVSRFKQHKRFIKFESGLQVPAARELIAKMTPGYGVTVHTMQGDSVAHAYMLVEDKAPVDREMTYTAVTRGTDSFTFIFDSPYRPINEMIMSAVSRERRERKTLLAEFIGKDVEVPPQQQTACSFCCKTFAFHVTADVPWRTMCDACTAVTASMPKAAMAAKAEDATEDDDADEPMAASAVKPAAAAVKPVTVPARGVMTMMRAIDPYELNED